MPVVPFAINPFGTGDQQTGSGNISITSGVATLTVSQTGNIGIGYMIEYNSINCLITAVNSPTSFDVIDVDGTATPNQGSTSVTSIHSVWASRSAMEGAFTGASFLNTDDLPAGSLNVSCECYYDDDDSTKDTSSFVTQFGTTDSTYFLTYRSPRGGTESVNDQWVADGVFDNTKYYCGSDDVLFHEIFQDYTVDEFLQYEHTGNIAAISMETAGNLIKNTVFECPMDNGTSVINYVDFGGGYTGTVQNCSFNDSVGNAYGILCQGTGTLNVYYCDLTGFNFAARETGGTLVLKNCAIWGNVDDMNGTLSTSYVASDDNDQGGTGDFQIHSTYSGLFVDPTGTPPDFDLLDYTSTGALINAGNPISGITIDLIGRTRDSSTPDVGCYEFLSTGNTLTASDGFEFSDSASLAAAGLMSMSDGFEVSDTFNATVSALMSLSDTYEFSDTSQNLASLIMSLSDSAIFTDIVSLSASANLNLSDEFEYSDQASMQSGNFINMSDGSEISDSFSADTGIISMTLNDGFSFADAVSAISSAVMGMDDAYILSDTVSLSTGELVEGPIKMTVQVKQSVFNITIKKPNFDIEVN